MLYKENVKKGWKPMIQLPSSVENRKSTLIELENILKPMGYAIGGNWEYERGFFDYKIDDNNGYVFLRLPFHATKGEIGDRGVEVALGRPFLLAHQYEDNLDDQVMGYSAMLNQFSEPTDKDADIPEKYLEIGKKLVRELEEALG